MLVIGEGLQRRGEDDFPCSGYMTTNSIFFCADDVSALRPGLQLCI